MIRQEIEHFELLLYKSGQTSLNNYYVFLEDAGVEDAIKKMYDCLKLENNFSYKSLFLGITKQIESLVKIDFEKLILIKKLEDYFYLYSALFAVKSFQSCLISEKKIESNLYKEELKNFIDSDTLINWCSREFFNLCLSINFVLNVELDVFPEKIRDVFIKIFFIFNISGLIKDRNVYFSNKKTYKVYELGLIFKLKSLTLKIYDQPFKIFENYGILYLFCGHFSSVVEVNRRNGFSNFKFTQLREFDIVLTQNFFYIDKDRLNAVIEDILLSYDKKTENLESQYIELQKLLKIYILQDNFKAVSAVSREISQLLSIFKLIKISKLNLCNVKIYTPHIICFRGRFYVLSDASFTFNVELRFCMYIGYYDQPIEAVEKNGFFTDKIKSEILKYKNELSCCNMIENFQNLKELEIVGVLFLMVSIAEYDKTKLGKEVSLLEFIKKGIETCNNFDSIEFEDVYDKIKVKYYIFVLKELLSKSGKKWLISKDATASYCQQLARILGPSNLNALKFCNLNSSNVWYDTYCFIIDNFLSTKIFIYLTTDDVKKWFRRSLLKKTIMTEAYGISLKRAEAEYFEEGQENFLDDKKLKELKETFVQFFKYLEINPLLFKQSPKNIITEIFDNNLSEITLKNGERANLKYFKTQIIQKSYFINSLRCTKQKKVLLPQIDSRKMKRALRANYVQLLESAVARHVMLGTSAPIIHDCFTIDYLNTPYLLSLVNEAMNIKFHDLNLNNENAEIFSIFIVL